MTQNACVIIPRCVGLLAARRLWGQQVSRACRQASVQFAGIPLRQPEPFLSCGHDTAELHIRSPLTARLAPKLLILEVIGLGRAEPIFIAASLQPGRYAVRPPSSRQGWSSLARRLIFVCCAPRQAAFIAAPSGISPWVTQRQRAIRSFRASATIVTRRTRPRS